MIEHPLMKDIQRVLIPAERVEQRVEEMAQEITKFYNGEEIVMVGILKGAVMFFAELIKRMKMSVVIDFMAISSYGQSTDSSGTVRMLKDLDVAVEGRKVLLVEDIVDTGLTLAYLSENMRQRRVESIHVATLLDKPERRKTPIEPDFCGFQVPNEFIVGYGLDYAGRYRNLPDVCVLKREIYTGG